MFDPRKLFQPRLTNTLAYCENSEILDAKSVITFGRGVNVVKSFVVVSDNEAK